MVSKVSKRSLKIIAILTVVIMTVGLLVGIIYSTNDNHYVVDVIEEKASSNDGKLQITEKIVKGANEQFFNSKELDYEVELKNIAQAENVETQVAIVIDSSYSMQTNDTNNLVKSKAIELATSILNNVDKSRVSISNNSSTKLNMSNDINTITTQINSLIAGEGNDSNIGLDNAKNSFTTPITAGNTVNKYIIVFTDSTDDVATKMQDITTQDSSIKIISTLVDMTSTSYVNNNKPVCGEAYLLLSGVTQQDNIIKNIELFDVQKICDNINSNINKIKVTNEFSEEILTYFDIIYKENESDGTFTNNGNGYTWKVDTLKGQQTATLKFKLKLKVNDVAAAVLFKNLYTNKTQDIEYEGCTNTLEGTDSRQGTESTVIKVCQGYDLRIKAVSEANEQLPVDGIKVRVVGETTDGKRVCDIEKTTDGQGYITITPEDARALRTDGTIIFTITPTVNKAGYSNTDSVSFEVTNDARTTNLSSNDYNNSNIDIKIEETKRLVNVTLPINSQKLDFELKVEELNNSNKSIAGCEFQLIQPKLNNNYEMTVLTGTTDATGTIHFSPTVMTKAGTYTYVLSQISGPNGYALTTPTIITIKFESDGTIKIDPETQFNPNIEGKRIADDNVLFTLGLENTKKDPFDLQINLADKSNGTKLEGVTYLIRTINVAQNIDVSEYATTNKDGQINTKIYGNGSFAIEITEQSPKVGYVPDTKKKIINVERLNGFVKAWSGEINPNDIEQNNDKDNLIINLYSQKKAEQNIVKVSLVEIEQTYEVAVGKDVIYRLRDDTGREYGPEISNRNGELKFVIDQRQQGQHTYTLFVDPNTIPNEYNQNTPANNVIFNLNFDADGYIDGINLPAPNANVIKTNNSTVSEENSVEYTAFIKIAYELNINSTAEFKVQLFDKDEVDSQGNFIKAIEGAQYKIKIQWDAIINGQVVKREKVIEGRRTNSQGQISTRIVRAEEMTIEITQTAAALGYNADSTTTQEIHLKSRTNGIIDIINQTPYDMGNSNTNEPHQGAYISNPGNPNPVIIYQHLNKKRSVEDTYVNLVVNKIDMNGAYVDGVILNIKSDTLVDKDNNKLNLIMKTGEQGSQGSIAIDYVEYLKNIINNNTIRVPGIGETENEIVYYMDITEMQQDINSSTGYSEKDGTKVRLKLIFRYRDNRIRLTNVETIQGNNLVIEKQFSSSSDKLEGQQLEDSMGVFLGNITLDLRTNYEDVGNLCIDLKKVNDNKNNPESLVGAIYDLKVTNPDGTVIRKNGIKIQNGNNSSDIELSGINVNVGSIIELTETTAPIGYALNRNTEMLEVTDIDAQGEITLAVKDPSYNPSRINANKLVSSITTAGTLKTNYEVTLIDQQLDTFEFEIATKDNQTHNGVSGFEFRIDTSKNATSSLTTGANGIGKTRVGGNIENDTITYTVSLNKVADYYKPLNSVINVNVVFDQFGQVDVNRTQNAQTDPNYGTLWNITTLNPTDIGPIGIEIFVEHQDPLVVNVETIDKITNKPITDVSYKIERSEVLPATGSSTIQVGYVLENGRRTYNLIQTNIKNTYKSEPNKSFTVTYANEIIDADPTKTYLSSTTPEDTLQVTGDKEITIKVYVEPKVPIEITNTYYFDQNIKLQGAEFEVISKRTQEKGVGTTDSNGLTVIYSDIFGKNDGEKVTYQIRQTKAGIGYATIEDFYVTVTYNANREITSAKLTDQNGTELPNGSNRFIRSINVSKDDTKYNFNNKGIVQIEVSNYPEFQIEIENIDRRNGDPISGTTYSVKSTYQETGGSIVNFTQTMNPVITGTDGIGPGKGIARLDKTKDNGVIKYTVKEDKPAQGYQSFGKDINIIVKFDENGLVKQNDIEIENQNTNIECIIKIDPITDPRDNFRIKLQLKNNPILKFNITKIDETNNNKIDGVGFTIVSKMDGKVYSNSSATSSVNQKNTPDMSDLTGSKGIQGHTELYLDRTIDNKSMYYTIEEVQKAPGYKWITDEMIVKVDYDENGKIKAHSIEKGQDIVKVKGFDKENFVIDLEIKNILIEEFGINLVAEDAYSNEKRINDLKVEAFLVKPGDTNYQTPDTKYNLMGNNALLTGADRNGDGKADEYGKDYLSMGKYTEGAGKRYLRLVIKNQADGTGEATNGSYYKQDSSNNTLGYYRGNEFVQDAYYQIVAYDYLMSVDFDDDGKILDSELIVGNNITGLGVTVDNQYIKTKNGNKIDHGDYQLNITMKLFPLLRLSIHGMDNYTWEDEQKTNPNGIPTELPGTKYTISTQRHTAGPTTKDEYVTAGYRGEGHYLGIYEGRVYGDIYESKKDVLYAPIEKATTGNPSKRLYYVFEDAEPTNYQKYTPWHYTDPYYNRLVAIISIEFDELGEFKTESYDFIDRSRYSNITLAQGTIIKAINNNTGNLEDLTLTIDTEVSIISVNGSTVEGRLKDGTRIQFTLAAGTQLTNRVFKANQGEFGNFLSDCDNLQDYDYFGAHNTAKRSLDFYIGYALTTKINVTAVDDISGSRISNIRMTPLLGGTYTTNRSYYYTTDNYRDTDSNGMFDMKYWGAAEQNSTNEYIIGSNRQGNDYNGYFFPSDMAALINNGSGNPADYYAKIEVTYGANGKISGITHKGTDLWGSKNSEDDFTRTIITPTGQLVTQQVNTTFDPVTGNIYIKMLYSRKFQVSLNKVDIFDNSINTLDAVFNVTAELPSGHRLNTTIRSNRKNSAIQLTPLGKVFKDTTIKYTLQETKAPEGYLPIDGPIEFTVTFDKNGNIGRNSVKSNSKYFELESTSQTTEEKNKTSPDLTIKIKNEPAFILNLRVIDKFYKADGISDIYFDIENSKGEKAIGTPQTDKNGYTNAIVGKIYPGEEIIYTIRQSNNKEPDYYRNETEIKLKVLFDNSGKIKEYNIISPGINEISEVVNNFNTTAYILKKQIGMEIMNMPKALKIGLKKYDKTTNQVMPDVKFTVTRENVNNPLDNNKDNPVQIQTNPVTGSVVEKIDEFTKGEKTIRYTIHEAETPPSYRTMEDVVLEVKYRADGSIERCNAISNDNGILNTDVRTEIARNNIKYMNGQDPQKQERVHLTAEVPNDNTYDLIIRNEDINYTQGQLGIEGSKFDVNITANGTGQVYTPALTDTNGMTILRDLTHNGDITISIAQKTVGEGYKYDVDNKVIINLEKGVNIYSIDLKQVDGQSVTDDKNATTAKAIIKVDEKHGKITVTFKNETKTELTILKQDVNNKKVLQNAKFEVTKQQLDNNGNPIGNSTTLTATNNSTTTDKDGKLHFELGVAPQSEVWVYTFKEITPPEGYNQIIDLTMKVTYDQYGRIISQEPNERTRLVPTKEHTNNNNCRSMYAIIYNGDISPAYTVKVVTEDVDTGRRINGSKIYMNITDNNGNSVPINQNNQTEGSAQNGQTDITGILGADWKKYTEAQWNDPNTSKPLRLEEGLVYIDSIDYQGILNIEVSQKGLAPGYIYGQQKTGGRVQIEAKYVPHLGGNPTLELTPINDDGFGSNLKIDPVNRTITIIIKNESEVLFKITTMEYKSNPNAEPTYLPVNYDITAEIQTLTGSEETDIKDKPTYIQAGDYIAIGKVGKAYAGKIVLYTLHQHTPLGYKAIDDIKVEIHYDTQGYIKYYEILSSEDNAYLDVKNTGGRTISLIVVNRKTIGGYRIDVEKHAMDTDDDRYAYGRLLPGAEFKITVTQQYNDLDKEWTGITDNNGLIEGKILNGYGYIDATIEEINAPPGYTIGGIKHFRFYRNPDTGEFEKIDGDVNMEDLDFKTDQAGNTIITLKPIDEQEKTKFTLIFNKYSNQTKELIKDNTAEFKATLIKEDDNGKIIYQDIMQNIVTDINGKAIKDNIAMPNDEGEYKLIIEEIKAPKGYIGLANPIEIPVTFKKDDRGNMIISGIDDTSIKDLENVSTTAIKAQLIGINIGNDFDQQIKDDEYSLDITKVDGKTGKPIENMALFKVWIPDDKNTEVYTETSVTQLGPGKLDYCYIEQDKDYQVRLTHMKLPKQPGTLKYIFREITPPEGYTQIKEDLELELTFDIDQATGKMIITNAKSSNNNYLRINSQTPWLKTKESFSIDILNYEDKLYLKSQEYLIGTGVNPASIWTPGQWSEYKDGDKYIKGIRPQAYQRENMSKTKGTKIDEFISNLDTNADEIKIYIPEIDANGNKILREQNVIKDTQRLVATGMILKATKGTQEITLTLIVRGDFIVKGSTIGNGYLDQQDITAARAYNPRRNPNLNDEELQAFDFCINTDMSYLQQQTAINYSYTNKTTETIQDSRNPRN